MACHLADAIGDEVLLKTRVFMRREHARRSTRPIASAAALDPRSPQPSSTRGALRRVMPAASSGAQPRCRRRDRQRAPGGTTGRLVGVAPATVSALRRRRT